MLPMIIFLFLGHSNMQGYCAAMDTIPNAHVWTYTAARGFFNCTDKDLGSGSGSPVMPFLKRMAAQYPGYNFCGIKHASPCQQAMHILGEERHRECLQNQISQVRGKGTFGGVCLMYGVVENQFNNVETLDNELAGIIVFVRENTGVSDLPVILGRFEENGNHKTAAPMYKYERRTVREIDSMPFKIAHLILAPRKPVPAAMFCDNHHYSASGYDLWAHDAVDLYIANNFDAWRKR